MSINLKIKRLWTLTGHLTVLFLLQILLQGCDLITYYPHLIKGHLQLISQQKPVSEVLEDTAISENKKAKLRLVQQALAFAETELGLPADDQYQTFVEIDRPYVVWNIYAAPEFSFKPKSWCYPVVGCLNYRGYYTQQKAINMAQRLQAQGLETYLSGAAAYSTLGWFHDPVLSSFLNFPDDFLAGLIFHELAHQKLFIKGDTVFNESFATTVEIEGMRRWSHAQTDYTQRFAAQQAFIRLALRYRDKLTQVYESSLTDAEKRREKQKIIAQFRQAYDQSEQLEWQGHKLYRQWMQGPLNNAQLNTVATYYALVPELQSLLISVGRDLETFYRRCEALKKLSLEERHQLLKAVHRPRQNSLSNS